LAVAFVALVIAIWLTHQTLRLGARTLPRLQNWLTVRAAVRSGKISAAVLRLVSPDHADFRLLTILLGLIGGAIIGFIAILEDVLSGDSGLGIDASVSQFFQALRTTVGDQVMI
jgi:hypothetical protein